MGRVRVGVSRYNGDWGILPERGPGVSRVVAEVRRFLAAHAVAGPGVVAVSGGADSVSLLWALDEAGAGPLTVAHLNHQLRGEESDTDERFVESLAGWLNVDLIKERTDAAMLARSTGENLEEAARIARLDFFSRVAARVGATWVATGHTADDQAETVLHRLVRGTGIQGLRGIAACRNTSPTVRLVRPLLAVTRADLVSYLEGIGEPFRTDSSNADLRFTRNRIRHELLPLLSTFNPEVVAVLGRLAEQADELFDHLESEAAALLATAELPRAGELLIFGAEKLLAAPPHRVRDALRLVWEREAWPRDAMTYTHWRRLAALTPGDYPGRIHVRRVGSVVQIRRHL
jgi:tRNA(Ile)-lysidine synthase